MKSEEKAHIRNIVKEKGIVFFGGGENLVTTGASDETSGKKYNQSEPCKMRIQRNFANKGKRTF